MSDKQAKRLLSIDALRGIAALIVLFYHSRAMAWVGMSEFFHQHHSWSWDPSVWVGWLTTPFRVGFVGVQLLFVLSGYCIHRNQAKLLAQNNPAKLDLRHFAFRRFFRIYPTYVAALIVNGLVLYQLLPWLGSMGFPLSGPEGHHSWYIFFMNLLTMQNVIPGVPPYEGVFWSLSLEIHLYIAYPLVLWISRNYGPSRMMLVSFLAGVGHMIASFFFAGTPTADLLLGISGFTFYWFTWCAGAYIAEMQFGRAKPIRLPGFVWMLMGAAGIALFMISNGSDGQPTRFAHYQFNAVGEFLMALMMAALLAWSIRPNTQHIWTSPFPRLLAFIGTFSFTLYAIHVPILHTVTALWGGKPNSVLLAYLAALIAIVVAYLFFNLVERWTLSPPKNFFVTKAKPPALNPVLEGPAVTAPDSTSAV